MADFEETMLCRAPALEVWKLLHDPFRFTEWWSGVSRVEVTPGGVAVYTDNQPGLAYPLHINLTGDSSSVRITCLLTEDIHIWTLQSHPDGCLVRVRVEAAPGEETQLAQRRAENVLASLPRLISAAERAA